MKKNERPVFKVKEWNSAGVTQFYSSMPIRTFNVEVYLNGDVCSDCLQKAVDKTLVRLPYYSDTFVRKRGNYYYAENTLPFLVAESEETRPVGGSVTNYHYLDVTFWKNRITFSMFHGICDGLGLNRFIDAVLYHYFCIKDGKTYSSEGIYTEAIPYDPAEEYDIYKKRTKAPLKEISEVSGEKNRFRFPELCVPVGDTMYSFPLQIRTEDFLTWCKSESTSPAAAVSAFMAKAVALENEDAKGVIMSVLPFSLRKYVNAEKTFKNCSSAIFLPTTPEDARTFSAGELAARLRVRMKEQMNERTATLLVAGMGMIIHLGKKLPFYGMKNKMMAMKERKPQDTFYIDYVGSLRTNDYSDQITGVRYLNPNISFGAVFAVMSETAGFFNLSLNQPFENDRYFRAMQKVLDEAGLSYDVLPQTSYLNQVTEFPEEQKS